MPNRPHVLIVEDDVELRASMAELLKADGYDIDLATDGAEAINRLESGLPPPCAMVVDLLMPGIVGQELLEYLRDDVGLATIPVAIFSASPHLAPNGYPVFRKPVDIDALRAFVRGCVSPA